MKPEFHPPSKKERMSRGNHISRKVQLAMDDLAEFAREIGREDLISKIGDLTWRAGAVLAALQSELE